MRLNLSWRGRDVIDVEVHAWRKRPDDSADEGPVLRASGSLQSAERAEPTDPDTHAFGFSPSPSPAATRRRRPRDHPLHE